MSKLVLVLGVFLVSCSSSWEKSVTEDRVSGLYQRSFYDVKEYLCVNKNLSYSYIVNDKVLSRGTWGFSTYNGKSEIGLYDFEYGKGSFNKHKASGYSLPVKYSYAKKSVLLRFSADNHFEDFIRIDSTSCEINP